MKNISVLIKPASSHCNIRCDYCFYTSIAEKREVRPHNFMEVSTLKNIVQKVLEYAQSGDCNFAFQGGEPTLIGLDFYREFVALQKRYNRGSRVFNSIQTNGILIDKEWARFFRENNFLVGLSLDGPESLHDSRRRDRDGYGTFHRVMKAKETLEKYGVEYNILTVVDDTLAENVHEVYTFFKEGGVTCTQYIPCLDQMSLGKGSSLSPEGYTSFLKKLFDLWYEDLIVGKYISIRYFDNLVNTLMGRGREACHLMGYCSLQNVVEADGSIYPCDFYTSDLWNLGNINYTTLEEINNSKKARQFLEDSLEVAPKCRKCKWWSLCRGECRRRRDNSQGLNILCTAYEEFLEYSYPRLREIALKIKNGELL